MNSTQIAALVDASDAETWADIWAPGVWFRVQPPELGLDHCSECSDGSCSDGCHVLQTLAQAMEQEGRWRMDGYEVVVIRGPERLADTGDVEGYVLPLGAGTIIARASFDELCSEYEDE